MTTKAGVLTLIDGDEFRKCMARFATGITVITTSDRSGDPHGMSANSFTSVCLDPPTVLVCIGHRTHTYQYITEQQCFGVNVLSNKQEDVGRYYARHPKDRVGDVAHEYTMSSICGVPRIKGTLAFIGCRIVGGHTYGDHTIYVGEVCEMEIGSTDGPLIFFGTKWYDPSLTEPLS